MRGCGGAVVGDLGILHRAWISAAMELAAALAAGGLLAVIRRPDYDTTSFESWLTKLQDEDKKVWANPLTPETLARYQNHTYFLQGLAVRLALEPESERTTGFKTRVLGILKTR